jgi:rhomboid protease GluP
MKVRYIFVPLLELAVGFCVVYSALNWLLVARGNLVPLSDDVATYWLPLGLAWLLVIFKVQPGLRLLKRDKRQNLPILYHAAAVAMIAAPTILVQGFVRSATGDLTHVGSLADISNGPATKYYSADDLCLDRSREWLQPAVSTSGRYNDTLNFYVYVAFPLCQTDRVRSRESVWVGYEFHKAVNNHLSTEEKDVAYNDFIRQSRTTASELDPKSFPFFERLGRSSNRKQFATLLARAGFDLDAPSTVLLIPHAERFEERTGHHLEWALVSFGIGTALWLGIALLCPLDSSRVHKWREQINAGANAQPRRRALELLIQHKGGYGLQILVAVNVLVYLAMVLAGLGFGSFDTDDLLRWGANYRPALHGVGYLRLVTSEFVHGGILHLLNNMYGLFFAGMFLLPITGNLGLIVCYLLAGLGGSIASAYIHPATVSVGASGAILGLFGMLLVHLVMGDKKLAEVRKALLPGAAAFVALNFLIGAASPGIDNAAHIGGFVSGVFLGFVFLLPWAVRRQAPARVANGQLP